MIHTPEGSGPVFDFGWNRYAKQVLELWEIQAEQQEILAQRTIMQRAWEGLSFSANMRMQNAISLNPVVYSRPLLTYNHAAYARDWEEGIAFRAALPWFDGSVKSDVAYVPVAQIRGTNVFPDNSIRMSDGLPRVVFTDEDALTVHGLADAVKLAHRNGTLPDLASNSTYIHDPLVRVQPGIPVHPPLGPVISEEV